MSGALPIFAVLVVLTLLLLYGMHRLGRSDGHLGREGYLIYPYLDLEEPGERGDYYALAHA